MRSLTPPITPLAKTRSTAELNELVELALHFVERRIEQGRRAGSLLTASGSGARYLKD